MITIIDYGMGNVGSIKNMIEYLGFEAKISNSVSEIKKANKIILPGVGSFDEGVKKLKEKKLIEEIKNKGLHEKIPILGICLGMQLLGKSSEEGKEKGLGLIDARTIKFQNKKLKQINMGWRNLTKIKKNKLTKNITTKDRFYFVHGFYVKTKIDKETIAKSEYEIEFSAIINKGNIYGTQFHPEKSLKSGMKILKNFIEL